MPLERIPYRNTLTLTYFDANNFTYSRIRPQATNEQIASLGRALNSLQEHVSDSMFLDRRTILRQSQR